MGSSVSGPSSQRILKFGSMPRRHVVSGACCERGYSGQAVRGNPQGPHGLGVDQSCRQAGRTAVSLADLGPQRVAVPLHDAVVVSPGEFGTPPRARVQRPWAATATGSRSWPDIGSLPRSRVRRPAWPGLLGSRSYFLGEICSNWLSSKFDVSLPLLPGRGFLQWLSA